MTIPPRRSPVVRVMLSSLARSLVVMLSSLALALAPTSGVAQPRRVASPPPSAPVARILVAPFQGSRAAPTRALLVQNLSSAGYTVISDAEVASVVSRLGLSSRRSRAEQLAVAAELHASVVIEGRVSRARRSWSLTVRVINGADGGELGSASWGGRSMQAIDGVGRNAAERLGGFIGAGRAATPAAESSGEPQWYQAGYHEDTESPIDDEEPGDEPDEPTDVERYDVGRIMVSGGTLWRSFSTIVDVYAGHHGGASPMDTIHQERSYSSPGIGHFELGLEGDFYPGALADQPFPYLGVIASFRHSLGIVSVAESATPGAGDVSLGTDQLDLRVGLRGRYRFGPRRGDFMLFADAGFVMSTFTFDVEALSSVRLDAIIPPMEYYSLELGLGFDVAIVRDALSIAAYGRGRIGVGLGVQTRNVWGIETPAANGFLFGLELRHDAVWIARGLFASLRLEYFQYLTQFRGQAGCYGGDCASGVEPWLDTHPWEIWPTRDPGDPASEVTGGAQDPVPDHNVRWGLYLGYAFD